MMQEEILQAAKLNTKDILKYAKSGSNNIESAQKSFQFHSRW